MNDEDCYYADLAEAYENRKPIGHEDAELTRYQEHQWEEEDNR